jgi:hypothetical protein
MLGTNISRVEVSGISKHGFWFLLDEEEELFVHRSTVLKVKRGSDTIYF